MDIRDLERYRAFKAAFPAALQSQAPELVAEAHATPLELYWRCKTEQFFSKSVHAWLATVETELAQKGCAAPPAWWSERYLRVR